MNTVSLIGRLTRDPEIRYGISNQMPITRFALAVNRHKDKDANDISADFPTVICFGKNAEFVEKYISKGQLIGVQGRIQTGSYEKDGHKVYTTEVVAERIEFLEKASKKTSPNDSTDNTIPKGFTTIDDIPF